MLCCYVGKPWGKPGKPANRTGKQTTVFYNLIGKKSPWKTMGSSRLLLSRWKIEEKEDRVIITLTTLSARNRRKIEGKLGFDPNFRFENV